MSGVEDVPTPTPTTSDDPHLPPSSPSSSASSSSSEVAAPAADAPAEVANSVPGVHFSLRDESEPACSVRFVNATSKNVELIWLDFLGREDPFQILSPDSTVSIRTYQKHPWIFRDSGTKERLYVKKYGGRGNFFEAGDFLLSLSKSGKYS